MKNKEIIDGNKLIAEFMGWQKSIYENLPDRMYKDNYSIGKPINQFEYNSSWDSLMPVVEKIETINRYNEYYPDMVTIWKNCCKINDGNNGNELFCNYATTKIEAVYRTVIEFIKWYNQQEEQK